MQLLLDFHSDSSALTPCVGPKGSTVRRLRVKGSIISHSGPEGHPSQLQDVAVESLWTHPPQLPSAPSWEVEEPHRNTRRNMWVTPEHSPP